MPNHPPDHTPDAQKPRVLWWGRSGLDYSRNRIMRRCLAELGCQIVDFWPRFSRLGGIEALLRLRGTYDLIWVPCFRQRDLAAASAWGLRHEIPILFDALISAYDKQVFERMRYPRESRRAKRLLHWERKLLGRIDLALVDTSVHQDFFHTTLGMPLERLAVVPVGAEEALFTPASQREPNRPLEVLFYGSFIPLQGPQWVIEAASIARDQAVHWHLVGNGPLRDRCESAAHGLENVSFANWIDYEQLPARIHQADIVLGVFGTTAKAQRVIPNKVYQALACGKPVITQDSAAYPGALRGHEGRGIIWVAPGSGAAIADAVQQLASSPEQLHDLGACARSAYEQHFSEATIREQLKKALARIPALQRRITR